MQHWWWRRQLGLWDWGWLLRWCYWGEVEGKLSHVLLCDQGTASHHCGKLQGSAWPSWHYGSQVSVGREEKDRINFIQQYAISATYTILHSISCPLLFLNCIIFVIVIIHSCIYQFFKLQEYTYFSFYLYIAAWVGMGHWSVPSRTLVCISQSLLLLPFATPPPVPGEWRLLLATLGREIRMPGKSMMRASWLRNTMVPPLRFWWIRWAINYYINDLHTVTLFFICLDWFIII